MAEWPSWIPSNLAKLSLPLGTAHYRGVITSRGASYTINIPPFVFPTSPGISRLKEMNFRRGQNWSKKNSLGKPFSFQDKTFLQPFSFFTLIQPNGKMYDCYKFSLGIVTVIFSHDLYGNSNLFSAYITRKHHIILESSLSIRWTCVFYNSTMIDLLLNVFY